MMEIENTNVVVVGGGIFGCAIAYYYVRDNPGRKVIVLERKELCNAATSRAAALMTSIRSKTSFIPLSLETYNVIAEMEELLGESMDLRRVGALHVAASEQRVNDLKELIRIASVFKQRAEYISGDEAKKMAPWLKADEATKIGYMPDEAFCDPYLLGTFFSRCAKKLGADFRQGVEVSDLIMDGSTACGVIAGARKIHADVVVIATGAWAPVLASKANVGLPMAPVRSQYWITDKHKLFPADSPIVLLPDAQAYARPEGGSLLFGIREKNSFSVSPSKIPDDISQFTFSQDDGMNDLSEVIDKLARFFPSIYEVGLKYYIAGFSGYTPDNNLTMGVPQGINNLLMATGCVGAGISVSGGVGLAFARMAAGKPNPFDFSAFSLERFGNVDPFSTSWLEKCAQARSQKLSG